MNSMKNPQGPSQGSDDVRCAAGNYHAATWNQMTLDQACGGHVPAGGAEQWP